MYMLFEKSLTKQKQLPIKYSRECLQIALFSPLLSPYQDVTLWPPLPGPGFHCPEGCPPIPGCSSVCHCPEALPLLSLSPAHQVPDSSSVPSFLGPLFWDLPVVLDHRSELSLPESAATTLTQAPQVLTCGFNRPPLMSCYCCPMIVPKASLETLIHHP